MVAGQYSIRGGDTKIGHRALGMGHGDEKITNVLLPIATAKDDSSTLSPEARICEGEGGSA